MINIIGIRIGTNIAEGSFPPGTDEIVTELMIQMVDEANSYDLITE